MKQTVGDLARESNETLAVYLTDCEALACPYCAYQHTSKCSDEYCFDGVLEHLNAPADEERDDEDEPVEDWGEETTDD